MSPGNTFHWQPRDVFVIPSWQAFVLESGSDAVLFSYSDRIVQEKLDFFREVLAIGAPGKDIAVADAKRLVFGYAAGVDLTRRDLQLEARKNGRPWESGKSFDASAPTSSIVRRGDARLHLSSGISLQVNGVTKQQAVLSDMIWSCDEIISRLSSLYVLKAGDLIFTGTPAGVGDLNPGDSVEATVEGVGRVAFTIAPRSGD